MFLHIKLLQRIYKAKSLYIKKHFTVLLFQLIILPSLLGGSGWGLHAQSGTWVYWGGTRNDNGNYGTQGVFSSLNAPSGRGGAACWTDQDGNFWLFGGEPDSIGGGGGIK